MFPVRTTARFDVNIRRITQNLYFSGIEDPDQGLKTSLVAALVTAADRLCDADEAQAALWFAQAALDRCDEREDVYCALMRAQKLSDRRSQAMETFLACRRFMVEELGMDPSERVMRLHRELIEGGRDGSPVSWGMEPGQGAM